jgi:transcriptional regulator with XRE-family HTH domain
MRFKNPRIALRAKQERLRKKLSQAELAKLANAEQSQISRFENGGDLTLSTLLDISRALDLELVLVPKRLIPAVDHVIGNQSQPGGVEDKMPPPLVTEDIDESSDDDET